MNASMSWLADQVGVLEWFLFQIEQASFQMLPGFLQSVEAPRLCCSLADSSFYYEPPGHEVIAMI